ncbi:MAG: hypothetical protein ACXVCV_18460, partial [Polyangia bacterium]
MKHLLYASLIGVLGCSSTPPLPLCSAAMPTTATATTGAAGASACSEGGAVSATKSADLTVDGYKVVGPAITFAGGGSAGAGIDATSFTHGVDFVVPYSPGKVPADRNVVVLVKKGSWPAHAGALVNVVVESAHDRVHFHAPDVATYQAAIKTTAGQKSTRHFTYRAVAGVSMGGFGSSVNFWLHPERYDAIGVMGADPGPDMTYTLGMIHDFFFSGFCTAADGANMIGQLCPPQRKLLGTQGERLSTFESFLYEKGAGVGLTLRRSLYVRANRDLSHAMGNGVYYNPDSMYLPPGVPDTTLAMTPANFCSQPIVLKKFFDKRYNPDGKLDVITFCDGNDSDANGLGKFDPAVAPTDPAQ